MRRRPDGPGPVAKGSCVIDIYVSDAQLPRMTGRLQAVIETPEFLRRAKAVGLSDTEREALVLALAANPEAGTPLGGGLRKMRLARQGGGKSGGYRTLHFYREEGLPVFLLTVFAKNERANITPRERDALVALCDQLAASYRRR